MRKLFISLFLPVIFSAIAIRAAAQTCSGSLGDPVIYQTFGSGPNPGSALPSSVTNLTYTTDNCPNDGYYTIVNAANLSPSQCHPTWQTVTSDHTGDPNGYMMLVNASYDPSIFFTQTANGLCPNTTYEFSAYILNLMTLAASNADNTVIQPNITFSIRANDGTLLATYNTGVIPPTAGPQWNKYGVYFTTPAGITDVIVTMNNNAPGGNGNDLVLDDIAFRACGPVVQTGFGDLTTTGAQEICEGSDADYTLTSSVGAGYTNPFLQWQINTNNAGWTNIQGETNATLHITITNAATGNYQYRLAVGEGQNINSPSCNVSSLPLTINVNPLPVVPLPATQTVCEGDTLTLNATGGASYVWKGPGIAGINQNPLVIYNVSPANAGSYSVVATSAHGCAGAPVQTTVNVIPRVVPGLIADQTLLCLGESAHLQASGGIYYKWNPSTGLDHDDIPNPVASPSQTTTYRVTISNGGCADSTKTVTISVYNNPQADAGKSKVIFEGQSTRLQGTVSGDNIASFYWSPSDYLDDPHSLTPVATPPHDITYTLNVISSSCGEAASSVFVRVYQKITIPNAFTPNGDGVNDYWNIAALVTYPESLTTIYTRDGQQVYKSIGYAQPWDGTANGSPVPTGTYYYIIDLKNGTSPISGWVVVTR
ncbi:MAG TPA: gliding motility-associated C-terminal domain-containing protein [Mucilaginibacter sp.]|nr:gliding motility-associated C-terminal domain-containing protein [Mucilaginibacter sp.]